MTPGKSLSLFYVKPRQKIRDNVSRYFLVGKYSPFHTTPPPPFTSPELFNQSEPSQKTASLSLLTCILDNFCIIPGEKERLYTGLTGQGASINIEIE